MIPIDYPNEIRGVPYIWSSITWTSSFNRYDEAVKWCNSYPSSNKYCDVLSLAEIDWYFEDDQDAMMFALVWS